MSDFSGTRSWSHHEGGGAGGHDVAGMSPGKQTLVEQAPVQLREEPAAAPQGEGGGEDVHSLAGKGTATAATSLPYFDVVQAAFGHHNISGLIAHTGEEAGATAAGMGAKGYTAGRHVVLGPGADLFTVAHEAAHFIEQQHGLVNLAGGVGKAGDVHEQRADAVAAKVVAGESVEGLLDQMVGHSGSGAPKQGASAEGGPVQKQETELAAAKREQIPNKLDNARKFERRLGVAAFNHPRAQQAATTVIDRLLSAVIPNFNEADADHQQAYGELFGKENLGDDNGDRANGAWSSGQVGTDFAVLREAMQNGNLREKMTGVYNASLGGFKQTVKWLMEEDRSEMVARGLDDKKLSRRKNQMKFNPGAKDLFRDPGNPIDRKKYSSFEVTGDTRIANPDEERKTKRTVGELDAEGIGLSQREKDYQYGAGAAPADDTALKWKEGGTWFRPNNDNKWVKKYQEKLLMPVTAGPSGTAMRLFQAWEYLSKPVAAVDFRLALLGWMLTGNDHSFHEIMTTSADFGPEYTPGLDAYRNIAPLNDAELLAVAGNEGFPDEANYRTDHVSKPGPLIDARVTTGTQASILSTVPQVDKFEALITGGGAFPGVNGGDVARAMALLVYTDDKNFGADHVSAFQFINNVLKGNGNWWTMYYFIRKDPALKAAYDANKFSIKELLDEAKLHAKLAVEGLQILPIFAGRVHRGYRSDKLPVQGEVMTENKIVSMSKVEGVSANFANHPQSRGRYHILCRMDTVRGRDLGAASMAGPGEAEVLFAPGSRFRVDTAPIAWAGGGADGYEVTLQEL